jgi:hypothetical protein
MIKNNITKAEWDYIVNNYFTGYYAQQQNLIRRKCQRALYLANQEYLRSYGPNKQASAYNKWYIPQYKIGVYQSKGSNILPRGNN